MFACPKSNTLLTTDLTGVESIIHDHALQFFHFSQCTEQWQGLSPLKICKRSQCDLYQILGLTGCNLTFHRAISEWSKRIVQYTFFHPCFLICFCCISSFSVLFICYF